MTIEMNALRSKVQKGYMALKPLVEGSAYFSSGIDISALEDSIRDLPLD